LGVCGNFRGTNDFEYLDYLQKIDYSADPQITSSHLQKLIDYTLQVQSLHETVIAKLESQAIQYRGFYVIVLAALITILSTSKKFFKQEGIFRISFLLVSVMYLVDIQQYDVIQRQSKTVLYDMYTVRALWKIPQTDSALYEINFSKADLPLKFASTPRVRWRRELESALTPNSMQIVFYMLPIGILSFISIYTLKKKKDE
jgi:hypothetical protein